MLPYPTVFSLSYCLIVLLSYSPTVLLSHCLTVLLSHYLSSCPTVWLSLCLAVLLSYCLTIILSYCHTVLVSYCLAILLPCCLCVLMAYCSFNTLCGQTEFIVYRRCLHSFPKIFGFQITIANNTVDPTLSFLWAWLSWSLASFEHSFDLRSKQLSVKNFWWSWTQQLFWWSSMLMEGMVAVLIKISIPTNYSNSVLR